MTEIRIRPAHLDDCPALGRILVGATNDTFRGIVPEQSLEWTPEQSAKNWERNFNDEGTLKESETLFVAEIEASVVGFALLEETRPTDTAAPSIDDKYTHELAVLQVAPEWQRQGIGRLLVTHVAARVQAKGATHLLVRVHNENPNQAFYERLGAVRLASQPHDWDGFKSELIIYGWNNIDKLINNRG